MPIPLVTIPPLPHPQRRRNLLLVAGVIGCAFTLASSTAFGQTLPAKGGPGAQRPVHVVPLQSSGQEGETSWLIEQDVPRIPKIRGLDRQLPLHIDRRLGYAFDVAQRGAIYTADAEFRSVLGLCALELDARDGGTSHREALRQGWIAVEEADQFSGDQIDWRHSADVRPVAVGHATPVLRNAKVEVDSIQAVQAYYEFAEERLTYACQGLPGASLAFYGLARTMVVPGTMVTHAAGKSALLHRVALAIAPQNVLAANELGVLLAQHGQLDDAQALFQQCVAVDATPETWRNLAVVYARKGDINASRSALATSEALATRNHQRIAARANFMDQDRAPRPGHDTINDTDKKQGIIAKLNFIPKLANPFRR